MKIDPNGEDDPEKLYELSSGGRSEVLERILKSSPPVFSTPGFSTTKRRKTETTEIEAPKNVTESGPSLGFGELFLRKSGWGGKGLGVDESGPIDLVSVEHKTATEGLGFKGSTFRQVDSKVHDVDTAAHLETEQNPTFIAMPPSMQSLKVWSSGFMINSIPTSQYRAELEKWYSFFCDGALVQTLFKKKSEFDGIDRHRFIEARKRSNPYETLGKHIFMNRAAMKMANLDYIYDFKITRDYLGESSEFYFADVCAGPGGFTEYIYWRKKYGAKGFGFTLRGKDDFKMDAFNNQAPHENFERIYGADGSGDIYKSENMEFLVEKVLAKTYGKGVDLVTADGGSEVEEHNLQEEYLKRLVMCQFLVALRILKVGTGVFVCKVFDTFQPFTVSLIYFLYCSFEKISLIKPFTSREANSERYVVCFNLKERPSDIIGHLKKINILLDSEGKNATSLVEIFSMEKLLADEVFASYIRKNNIELVKRQIKALENLYKYVEDEYLQPFDERESVKDILLKKWDLPPVESFSKSLSILYDASNVPVKVRDAANFIRPDHRTKGFFGEYKNMEINSKDYQKKISLERAKTVGQTYTLSRSRKKEAIPAEKEEEKKAEAVKPVKAAVPMTQTATLKPAPKMKGDQKPMSFSKPSNPNVPSIARKSTSEALERPATSVDTFKYDDASQRRRRSKQRSKAIKQDGKFTLTAEQMKEIMRISVNKDNK